MGFQLGALMVGTLVSFVCLWLGTRVAGAQPDATKTVSIAVASNLVYIFVPFLGNPAAVLVLFSLLSVWAKLSLRHALFLSLATHGLMFLAWLGSAALFT